MAFSMPTYFWLEEGRIDVSRPFIINGSNYVQMSVANYARKSISGLKVIVPAEALETGSIRTSSPLELEVIDNKLTSDGYALISLSAFKPETITLISIPIRDGGVSCCEVVNGGDLGLVVSRGEAVSHPVRRLVMYTAVNAAIATAIYALALLWWRKRLANSDERADKINEELSRIKNELSKMEDDAHRVREKDDKEHAILQEKLDSANRDAKEFGRIYARTRAILLRRLADYNAEVRFWRDTVRRIVYAQYDSREKADQLISVVTKSLRTYGAIDQILHDDIDALQPIVDMLKKDE